MKMDEWMNKFGWSENPFNFRIYPELIVGYKDELGKMRSFVESGNKFSLLLGETGAGKTNALKWMADEVYDERNVYYMPKPPQDEESLLSYLRDDVLNEFFFTRWFTNYSLYNIHERLDEKLDESCVLIIDEGHEASQTVLEWVRTAIDHVNELSVIAAGLPSFEDRLREEVHTLYSRATAIVRLDSLDRDESIELVRRRIERVGGSSVEPFTRSALRQVYDHAGGFPREILRTCNECVIHSAREDLSIIDEEDVGRIVDSSEDRSSQKDSREEGEDDEDFSIVRDVNLTSKQERIVDILEEQGACTSGEIVDTMDSEDYTSRSNAVRSVNNILKRLMENDLVDRERRGRSYSYFLDG